MVVLAKKNETHVAVVDDSELSRKAIIEILEDADFNVAGEASSASEAIQLSHQTSTNIWVIDVVMPEISGIELAKHLTDNQRNIAIIMISSLKMENIIIESISNGAIDFLQKPFAAEDLVRSVRKIAAQIENEQDL